jgi:hypothetical protein
MQISFVLNTTTDVFYRWMYRLASSRWYDHRLPDFSGLGEGELLLSLGPFNETIWRNSDERFALRGRYYTDYDEFMATDGRHVGEIIVVRTWGMHGGRVEVTVECRRQEASWIYMQLLRAIDLDFPEAHLFARPESHSPHLELQVFDGAGPQRDSGELDPECNRAVDPPGSDTPLDEWIRHVNPPGRPGRPSYREDIWAAVEVYVKGRPEAEVYEEWLTRWSPGRDLVDPKDSFKKQVLDKRDKLGGYPQATNNP